MVLDDTSETKSSSQNSEKEAAGRLADEMSGFAEVQPVRRKGISVKIHKKAERTRFFMEGDNCFKIKLPRFGGAR